MGDRLSQTPETPGMPETAETPVAVSHQVSPGRGGAFIAGDRRLETLPCNLEAVFPTFSSNRGSRSGGGGGGGVFRGTDVTGDTLTTGEVLVLA